VAASVPMDMMDSDLPCPLPMVLLPDATFGVAGNPRPPAVDGVLRDSVGRWPRRFGGGLCDTNDELRDMEGLVVEGTGGSLRGLSPPGAKPFCLRNGERSCPADAATFLKVMVHSTSSPANTVASFHCTNTRMFDADMVRGIGGAGSELVCNSLDKYVQRHDSCRM
jgi:hypothetical protein